MSDSRILARVTVGATALLAGLALTACGTGGGGDVVDLGTGGGPTSTAPGGGGAAEQPAVTVPVSAFEYGYDLLTPTTAGTYTFAVVNNGAMEHDLVIEGDGANAATAILRPGDSEELTVDLAPGTYTLYCSVGTHRSQGMEVTFTVV